MILEPSLDWAIAFHSNQSLWLQRVATAQLHIPTLHPAIHIEGDTLAVLPGSGGVVMLPPAGDTGTIAHDHDAALAWLRRSRARDVLTWSVHEQWGLDVEILARGYRASAPVYLMGRDLQLPIANPQHRVAPVQPADVPALVSAGIPYVIHEHIPATLALTSQTSGHDSVHWIMAREHRSPVGHAIVHIAGDMAGLFNVGVAGKHRHRGIGTSLVLSAMQVARDHGATSMVLNSTPTARALYHRLGFDPVGKGFTWSLTGPAMRTETTNDERVLIRAIGNGDVQALPQSLPMNAPRCGLGWQELAARWHQPGVIQTLIDRGEIPDIISLWDAGLKEEALAATENPTARELPTRTPKARPIHHAVQRGAGSLVIRLIAAGADLNAEDEEYHATPLDWAHANNKPTIARIIRQAGGR